MLIMNYLKRIYEVALKFVVYYYHKAILAYSRMLFTKRIALVLVTFVSAVYFVPKKLPNNFALRNSYIEALSTYVNSLQEKYANDDPLPAEKLKHLKPKHPVIIIPGITSTILELWQGSKREFRTNVWGNSDMFLQMITDVNGWADLITLDPETGLDKPHCKVRPANGLSSSDYIMPMYWVWQKMLNNFGIIGYDHINMHVSTYDWRLSCENLEVRDKYFSKLKLEIEMYYKLNNEKIVLLTHSYGSVIILYFLNWVEIVEEGFVEKYIHTFINIAAPFLGVSKSISGLLSGESRTTVSFLEGVMFDFLINSDIRKRVFQSWGSVKTLLPKGGAKIWGSGFILNIDGKEISFDELMHVLHNERNYDKALKEIINRGVPDTGMISKENVDAEIKSLKTQTSILYEYLVKSKSKRKACQNERNELVHKINRNLEKIANLEKQTNIETKMKKQNDWVDPTKCKLPYAPSMKIYSCYGVGKVTERGYYYTFTKNGNLKINTKYRSDNVINGVSLCDGDGTVPVFSLGYMSYRGWKDKELNPAGIKTYTREYKHSATFMKGFRGGPFTSEHVDILGNYDLTNDVLRICCGEDDCIEDKIASNIKEICDEIDERK